MKRLFLFSLVALLGLTFVISISSSWSAGTLKVTTPNGGQKWKTGKKYAIKWVMGNAGGAVKIQLLKSGKHYKWISKKTKNDGKYTWKIPTTVVTGSAYKVKIVSVKNKRVFDKSNKNFTITQADSGGGPKLERIEPTSLMQQTIDKKEAAKKHRSVAGRNVKTVCSKIKNISIGSTINSSWKTTDCSATPQAEMIYDIGYAKFYSFRLSSRKTVTFHLYARKHCGPPSRPTMVLRKGKATSGSYIKRVNAACYNSGKLRAVLAAGTYTLEAAVATWADMVDELTGPFVLDTSCIGGCSAGDDSGSIKVTTPNGGEKWKPGKKYLIKWDIGSGGTFVRIQLLKSDKHYKWVSKKTKNDGKHPWKVPATVASGSAYKIKITSVKNKKVFDKSNKNFTISKTGGDSDDDDDSSLKITNPNGGETWDWGKAYAIKWDKAAAGKFVRIFLLKSTGKRYKTISKKTKNDGKYPWKVPATTAYSSAYKIRVQSVSDSTQYDDGDANFTIGEPLAVTAPNGNETLDWGKSYAIKWDKAAAGEFVRIFLLKSTGKRYETISRKTLNDGNYQWFLSRTIAYGSYKIRVQSVSDSAQYDDSDANFTIGSTLDVTSPNGGESWNIGSTYTITWDQENVGNSVRIYLYKSGSFNKVISSSTTNDGSYSLSIPSTWPTGSTYKIRVLAMADNRIFGESDSYFTIVRSPPKVTSPNGGESWNPGSTYTITWDEANADDYVTIYLYRSGSLDRTINYITSNDGSYSWYIPSTATTGSTYKIRVTSYSDSSIYDESDNNFSIEEVELPSGDYQYLYDRNASAFSGYTWRWPSKTIKVSGADYSGWRSEFNRWPTVGFNFGASGGITIAYDSAVGNEICGDALPRWYTNGEIFSCRIRINPNYDPFGYGCNGVIAHEVGHCIGVYNHTSDGGLMDPAPAAGSGQITSPVRNMVSLLYSLDPGTDIYLKLSRSMAQRNLKKSKYDPNGKDIISKLFVTPIRK